MRNYIIKLLNIPPERIKIISPVETNEGTDFYVELVPTFPDCPYCGGYTISNGHGRPKSINHPSIVSEKNHIVLDLLDINARTVQKPSTRTILLRSLPLKTLSL